MNRRAKHFFNRLAGPILTGAILFGCLTGWGAQTRRHSPDQAGLKSPPDLSDQFFTNSPLPQFKIEIKGTNLAALQRNNRAYVRATVTEGETVYANVGIHLKGAAGSFRELTD